MDNVVCPSLRDDDDDGDGLLMGEGVQSVGSESQVKRVTNDDRRKSCELVVSEREGYPVSISGIGIG